MSVFPTRTTVASNITIHWSLETSPLEHEHVLPLAIVGVKGPSGEIDMLFEGHVPVLPSIGSILPSCSNTSVYLNKSVPLIVSSSCNSHGESSVTNGAAVCQSSAGRHYYFRYFVPPNARLGKYTLISEVYLDGVRTISPSASDEVFYVERLSVEQTRAAVTVTNHSPEPTPAKILRYVPGDRVGEVDIRVFIVGPYDSMLIEQPSENLFLSYNEERIVLPLWRGSHIRCIRNQRFRTQVTSRGKKGRILLIRNDDRSGYELSGVAKDLWLMADGLATRERLRVKCTKTYDEMVTSGLIIELQGALSDANRQPESGGVERERISRHKTSKRRRSSGRV